MIRLLFLLFIPSIIFAADIYDADGNVFGKSQGQVPSREPYEVVDTVKMSDGTGTIILNDHTTKEKHNVLPTDKNSIFIFATQLLDYTNGANVYCYGAYVSDNLDTIILKSSNNSDTSKVHVRILMK